MGPVESELATGEEQVAVQGVGKVAGVGVWSAGKGTAGEGGLGSGVGRAEAGTEG